MQARSANRNGVEREKPRQRFQRTLRSIPSDPVPSRPYRPPQPRQHPDATSRAVEPEIPVASRQAEEEVAEVQYQCTSCDMLVGASDAYCPFCGAVFADGPLSSDEGDVDIEEAEEDGVEEREPFVRPQKFDNLSMLKPTARSRDLLYVEAMKGFTGSARLLEEIEVLITDVGALGSDTTRARRLMSTAWDACREGDWPLVSALAKQTEDLVTPSIPDLVRMELGKARNLIVEAKSWGAGTSRYLLTMKSAMSALHREDLDEALRLTKELLDTLREDSTNWKNVPRQSAAGVR